MNIKEGTQCIILAGGLGKRLGELTEQTPKPLLPIGDKLFLDILIKFLKRNGITRIILTTRYLSSRFNTYLQDRSFELEIIHITENSDVGTFGALLNIYHRLEDEFLVVNGDTFFEFDLKDFLKESKENNNAEIYLACRDIPNNNDRYTHLWIREDQSITSSMSNKSIESINAGFHFIKKIAIQPSWELPIDIENSLLPDLMSKRKAFGKKYEGYFIDIGVHEDYIAANEYLPRWDITN